MDNEKLVEHVIREMDQTQRRAESLRDEVQAQRISMEALLDTMRAQKKSKR